YGHCLHHEEGAYPVRAMVLQVGGMRVLGLGSASLTLLAQLPDMEIEALYARHIDEFKPYGLTPYQLKRLLLSTKKNGFADTHSLVTKGVSGVGVGFELRPGNYAAISIAAIANRMQEPRKDWIAQLIIEELTRTGFKTFGKKSAPEGLFTHD